MAKLDKSIRDAAALGIVAGMRAMMPAALLSHHFSKNNAAALSSSRLHFIESPLTANITKLLSAAELGGDKLPGTPARIVAPQLIARIASGAFAGAVIFEADGQNPVKGAVIGGAAAILSTYALYFLRKKISTSTNIKDAVSGGVEDALALATGRAVLAGRS